MTGPSQEAASAYKAYFEHDPSTCYYLPFLKHLVYFLVDEFDLGIDPSILPKSAKNETMAEETIRIKVIDRLLDEFAQELGEPLADSTFHEGDDDEGEEPLSGYAYKRILEVFYFCLNRQPRVPSDANRDPKTLTAQAVRNRRWKIEMDKRFEQGKRAIMKPSGRTSEKCSTITTDSISESESESDIVTWTDQATDDCRQPQFSPNFGKFDRQTPVQQTRVQSRLLEVIDPGPGIPLPPSLELEPLKRGEILEHLVAKVDELHAERYQEILNKEYREALCTTLERNLVPGVRAISESGLFSLEGILSIGGNVGSTGAGIYLHILWYPNNPQQFWLYVGQATDLRRRIADHNDKLYRRKHPSLHYHVWDAKDNICSQFVILARADIKNGAENISRLDQCLLNMQEMWMACLFITLTSRDLEKYLPLSVSRASSGRHLNVVPPLWQRFQNENIPDISEVCSRPTFREFLQSKDPTIRRWAEKARDSYNDLRNSTDPQLRQYWFENNARQLQEAWEANDENTRENLKAYQISGKEETVQCSLGRSRGFVTCGKFNISLPQALRIPPGSKVHVKFHLHETGIPHRYAPKALNSDPSSRLAISITGVDASGHHVSSFLQSSRGENLPMRMNTLVDVLEDVTFKETCLLRRRWVVTHSRET